MFETENASRGVVLVAPTFEELTVMNAAQFRRHMLDLIEGGNSRIVIDMGKVVEVDSSGIGALVVLLKRIGLRGEMALCGLSEKVARLFRLTHMDGIFAIHADREGALSAMAK